MIPWYSSAHEIEKRGKGKRGKRGKKGKREGFYEAIIINNFKKYFTTVCVSTCVSTSVSTYVYKASFAQAFECN